MQGYTKSRVTSTQWATLVALYLGLLGVTAVTGGNLITVTVWYFLASGMFIWFRQGGAERDFEDALQTKDWRRVFGHWLLLAVVLFLIFAIRRAFNGSPIAWLEEVLRAGYIAAGVLTFIYVF